MRASENSLILARRMALLVGETAQGTTCSRWTGPTSLQAAVERHSWPTSENSVNPKSNFAEFTFYEVR
jgi:hypothetical protein